MQEWGRAGNSGAERGSHASLCSGVSRACTAARAAAQPNLCACLPVSPLPVCPPVPFSLQDTVYYNKGFQFVNLGERRHPAANGC